MPNAIEPDDYPPCDTCQGRRTLFRDVEEIACFDCCDPDGEPKGTSPYFADIVCPPDPEK